MGALVVLGVCIWMLLGPRGVLAPRALTVTLPAVVIGPGPALLLPPMLFIFYNAWMCRLALDRVHPVSVALTTLLFGFSAVVSVWYYLASWSARGFTTPGWMYNIWALINGALMMAGVGLLVSAYRRGSVPHFILAHLVLFVWFFSFAFPWLGESP